jgi:hypothetical protein
MNDTHEAPPAWQPITPSGVAAFARASLARLLLVQLLIALLAAGVIAWCLHRNWFPKISEAIEHLPPSGQIQHGTLDWSGDSPTALADGRFLALTVDLQHAGSARSPAHVQVEFGRSDVRVFSLFGFVQADYPRGWTIRFNRPELEPRWGAWAPAILALVIGAVTSGLLLIWALLASLYCWPAWLVAFFGNRDLTFRGGWRLAGATLMPGALFLTVAIILYGLGLLDLVRLAAAAGLHLVIGWVYVLVSPFWLPRHPEATVQKNPFVHH